GLKRLQNKRLEALQLIEELEPAATPEHLATLQYLHCTVSAEQSVMSGAVPKEQFASLTKGCVKPKTQVQKITVPVSNNPALASLGNPAIFPNPTANAFNVVI